MCDLKKAKIDYIRTTITISDSLMMTHKSVNKNKHPNAIVIVQFTLETTSFGAVFDHYIPIWFRLYAGGSAMR